MPAAGYKLFVTGDVLTAAQVNDYLMLQTVMVFANSAARTSALSAVLAEGLVSYLQDTNVVEVYTGAAWVSLDDPNAIQNSIVDAKGDIISATADNTPARLALGTNGQVLTVDTTTATGLKYATPAAGWPTAVGASVYLNGGTIAYTSGVETLMVPNTSDYDTNSFWASGANASRLTIPSGYAGKYLISMTVRETGVGSNYARLFLYKNGARVGVGLESGMFTHQANLGANTTCLNASVLVNAAVADYFQVYFQGDVTTASHATYIRYSISYQGA